jgi:3-deoxy-7-phosphoheptulonate synthase
MTELTSDRRIESIDSVRTPQILFEELPLGNRYAKRIVASRQRISNIIHGTDRRLLVVIGPCSIHDPVAAREYAERLYPLHKKYANTLEIVMRMYFEKPRTTVGWKGLINDPKMDGSFDINDGLTTARRLLLDLAILGMPAGCEFLDAATGQYYADLVSWGAIGARTTESQIHREIASGLSCPVGFKNGTNGNVDIATDAMKAAGHPHSFLSPNVDGVLSLYRTTGNDDAHLILRGGKEPNYDSSSVEQAIGRQKSSGMNRRIIIDCSHANSGKDYRKQVIIAQDIAKRLPHEIDHIGGLMIESHLIEGNQHVKSDVDLTYGQSITDACIGWSATETLLDELARKMKPLV